MFCIQEYIPTERLILPAKLLALFPAVRWTLAGNNLEERSYRKLAMHLLIQAVLFTYMALFSRIPPERVFTIYQTMASGEILLLTMFIMTIKAQTHGTYEAAAPLWASAAPGSWTTPGSWAATPRPRFLGRRRPPGPGPPTLPLAICT
jgi:hypothetical protein